MYTGKLWDKKSPINGVSAEKIMTLYSITSKNTVGLVCDGSGRVSVVVCNPNFKNTDVEKMLAEQVDTLNNQPELEPETEPEPDVVDEMQIIVED